MESEDASEDRGSERSGRGFREPRGPVPVKEGEEYDVRIEAVGRKGDGIAKVSNFIIFVPGTKTGDQVKVKITGIKGSFATATIVQ